MMLAAHWLPSKAGNHGPPQDWNAAQRLCFVILQFPLMNFHQFFLLLIKGTIVGMISQCANLTNQLIMSY